MEMVYYPSLVPQNSTIHVGKYIMTMDPMGTTPCFIIHLIDNTFDLVIDNRFDLIIIWGYNLFFVYLYTTDTTSDSSPNLGQSLLVPCTLSLVEFSVCFMQHIKSAQPLAFGAISFA